jgi:uncharacterized membrane-anchored protein
MVKSDKDVKLNTLEEVINYIKDADALLIRNIEGEPKNWIENYSKMKRGKPEKIEISEDLFMDCFDSPYFRPDPDAPKKKDELYFVYWELPEEE